VTVQAILHYFPTKDDLILGVLARRDEVDIQAVAPSGYAVGSAGEFIEIIWQLVARNAEPPRTHQAVRRSFRRVAGTNSSRSSVLRRPAGRQREMIRAEKIRA
jgi:AcrR family transcriptional regulator